MVKYRALKLEAGMMSTSQPVKMSMYDRTIAVLRGEKPDRIPFVTRLDLWINNRINTGTMPERYQGIPQYDIYRDLGVGIEVYLPLFEIRLNGVEMIFRRNNEVVLHEHDPVVDDFPVPWAHPMLPITEPHDTHVEFITRLGTLSTDIRMTQGLVEEGVSYGVMTNHVIKQESDCRIMEHILENLEFVDRFDQVRRKIDEVGEDGFVLPGMGRSPFQKLLLDIFGEVPFFYAMADMPEAVDRLLALLDERIDAALMRLKAFDYPLITFDENIDGFMTNPRFMKRYIQPRYEKYADILHSQNKLLCAHTDGDLSRILRELGASALDIAESFTPAPQTKCDLNEALEHLCGNNLTIWGAIPSIILEDTTTDTRFEAYMENLLGAVSGKSVVLGVADLVMGNNSITRVKRIAEMIEAHGEPMS